MEKNQKDKNYYEDEIDLGKLFFVLWVKKRFIILFTSIITLLVIGVILITSVGEEELFLANSRIKIYSDDYKNMVISSLQSNTFSSKIKAQYPDLNKEQIYFTFSNEEIEKEMLINVIDSSQERSAEIVNFTTHYLNEIVNQIYKDDIKKNNENNKLLLEDLESTKDQLEIISDVIEVYYKKLDETTSTDERALIREQITEYSKKEKSYKTHILAGEMREYFDYSKMKILDSAKPPLFSLQELAKQKKLAEDLKGYKFKRINKRLVVVISFLISFILAIFIVLITNFIKDNKDRFAE